MPPDFEPCILKPELISLLKEIKSSENFITDHRTFQILNTVAIEYKSIILSDLVLLKTLVFLVSKFIRPESNLPELGKSWAFRVLRWLLVIDPDAADISEIKKSFLMALPSKQFYLTQMELGLEKLVEKILFFIAVKNENLMLVSLEGFSEYFKIDPNFTDLNIFQSTREILDQLIESKLLSKVPDNFISNLILESSSNYYNLLDQKYKKELCLEFIDVFEFEILNYSSSTNWFIHWLSQDLSQFKRFCQFSRGAKPELKPFLDQLLDEIVEFGRLKGFHSKLSYNNCVNE